MRQALRSLVRIASLSACALALSWCLAFAFLRQPDWGRLHAVPGPRADPARLHRHVFHLALGIHSRDADHPEQLAKAAAYIDDLFRASGGRSRDQVYEVGEATYRNVIASFGPREGPRWVVGAHYDSFGLFGENPGADDNASGTAGLLELARLLGESPPSTSVELVAFANEEPPFFASPGMGSAVHAASLEEEGRPILGMVCLEMIGYFSRSQPWPGPIWQTLYPDWGDFILVVGRWQDRTLTRFLKRGFRGRSGVPAYSLTAPFPIPGLDASDHRSYWAHGLRAVMVTDTAFLRNPHYHTAQDRPETLDYQRMAAVVDGLFLALRSPPPPSLAAVSAATDSPAGDR